MGDIESQHTGLYKIVFSLLLDGFDQSFNCSSELVIILKFLI